MPNLEKFSFGGGDQSEEDKLKYKKYGNPRPNLLKYGSQLLRVLAHSVLSDKHKLKH